MCPTYVTPYVGPKCRRERKDSKSSHFRTCDPWYSERCRTIQMSLRLDRGKELVAGEPQEARLSRGRGLSSLPPSLPLNSEVCRLPSATHNSDQWSATIGLGRLQLLSYETRVIGSWVFLLAVYNPPQETGSVEMGIHFAETAESRRDRMN